MRVFKEFNQNWNFKMGKTWTNLKIMKTYKDQLKKFEEKKWTIV